MSNPLAIVEIAARSTGLFEQLREARAMFGRFATGVASEMSKAYTGARSIFGKKGALAGPGGFMGDIATGAAHRVGAKALDMFSGGVESTLEFEKTLTAFGVAARKTPAELDQIRKSVSATSLATGTSRQEILQGRRALVDLAGATADSDDMMNRLAVASKATGAEMSDVVGTVYSLRTGMKVADKDMNATLSGLVNMSKDGAVHFNQLAQELTAVAPQFANFGVTGREGAIQLGALFQVTRDGFKDASETATGLSGIFKGLGLHADRFAEAGVRIFNVSKDGTKTWRPISEVFKDIDKSVLAKNPDFLMKAFGRGEGYRAYDMIRKRKEKYEELIKAGQAATTIEEDFQTVISSPSGRIERAMNSIKVAIADALTPERIERFAAGMEKVAGFAAKTVDFLDNSVKAIKFLTGGGTDAETDSNSFELELLDKLNRKGTTGKEQAEDEEHAIKAAKYIADASDEELAKADAFGIDKRKFGGYQNIRAGAKKFLNRAEGMAEGWDYGARGTLGQGVEQGQARAQLLAGGNMAPALKEAMAPVVALLAKIAAKSEEVKVGEDTIAKASKNAPQHRRGVAR